MEQTLQQPIGQWVADDYRTAQVFKKHKIDFCCKGNRTVAEVALKKGLDPDNLLQELTAVLRSEGPREDCTSWPLDLLADYIEKIHHRYVEATLPTLKQYLDKLCKVHGERHPELHEIREHLYASAGELAMHMKKEELVLFPWIRKMENARQSGTSPGRPKFMTVKNPIAAMMDEHDNEGERFRKIAALSDDYQAPSDACATYRVAYALLQEFEADLHRHIHLENNILFPKAQELERVFTAPSGNPG
ncbi:MULTISPECIES: iron-sulfur cluster repair di-iron protein [unclassified Robiginitalea]|uniref:iron-sulfur cluster repair di-iron protein n=1 Tax=Robiginitalea TaxID=252306 RepID=UPI00234A7752|nr:MULTISPECIES: iron-sulfur cluster repair di-iron protein [unclassified Robiginitalea]MDC6355341.1 iron-sulfur cluster repair di-iron protein [Robiginitalea sp. PM2]MDC6375444.1 iron-sulfur cluster repair di-iron protein [Robiginitalea sp. SP8]